MTPALNKGLILDDLIHRIILVEPSKIPEGLYETGMIQQNPGDLSTALFNLFGFSRNLQDIKKCKDYGIWPWWTDVNMKGSLWRPLSSFTHWLDYQLFPDSPALM
ncbi:unnamed protein product, partial [marine sediment metagenome]